MKKYSLDCEYYNREFNSLNELLIDIQESGMDPNYNIKIDDEILEETAWDILKDEV